MIFKVLLLTIAIIAVLLLVTMIIKAEVTLKHYNKIIAAIHQYNMNEIECSVNEHRKEKLIPYSCIRNFDKTFVNLRDWSDKHIVPRKVYRRIRPYFND